MNPLVFSAPALLDTLGSFLNFTGLALISASTYQIMKMLTMVFVVLLSVTVLRKQYSIIQYLAVALVMAGLLFVSFFDVYGVDSNDANSSTDSASVAKHYQE